MPLLQVNYTKHKRTGLARQAMVQLLCMVTCSSVSSLHKNSCELVWFSYVIFQQNCTINKQSHNIIASVSQVLLGRDHRTGLQVEVMCDTAGVSV